MKKLSLLAAGLLFASTSVYAAGNHDKHAQATGSNETVKMMVVDMKGKPPYKRTVETFTVTDIAALEEVRASNVADDKERLGGKRIR